MTHHVIFFVDPVPAIVSVDVHDNGDDGIQLEESGDGDLLARIVNSVITDNNEFGVKVEQGDAGGGTLRLQQVTFAGNGDGPFDATDVAVIETGTP